MRIEVTKWGAAIAIMFGIFLGLSAYVYRPTTSQEPVPAHEFTAEDWFQVTEQKESSGNANAIGAAGELGLYQIMPDFWTDGCEGAGVRFDYDALVRDRAACQIVIRGYWKKYDARTWEERSRMHNGGPRGMQKQSTIDYWIDIKARMNHLQEDLSWKRRN